MLRPTDHLLFAALRTALWGAELPVEEFAVLSAEAWKQLYKTAAEQGVLALAYDAIKGLPADVQPPRGLRLQWAVNVEQIENRHKTQYKESVRLAECFKQRQLKTVVLKGLAIGTYYPTPEHRECGDLDCYLIKPGELFGRDGYEIGNEICTHLAAKIETDYYKHSHIKLNTLVVENHKFFLPIRGKSKMKALEQHLRQVVLAKGFSYINQTRLLIPSPNFNALFLTMHALNHFLSEGIKLRHITDWAVLLHRDQDLINWQEFYYWSSQTNMTRFANALTAISVKYLGLVINNSAIQATSSLSERVVNDTLFMQRSIFNKGYSEMVLRWHLFKNKLLSSWKYHEVYQKTILGGLINNVFGCLFDRNPKL